MAKEDNDSQFVDALIEWSQKPCHNRFFNFNNSKEKIYMSCVASKSTLEDLLKLVLIMLYSIDAKILKIVN